MKSLYELFKSKDKVYIPEYGEGVVTVLSSSYVTIKFYKNDSIECLSKDEVLSGKFKIYKLSSIEDLI